MAIPSRAPRRQLTPGDAENIRDELQAGKRHRVADVIFPADQPVEIRTLRDVEFDNCKLWLNIDGGLLRRGRVEGWRFLDVQLETLRMWNTDVRSVEFEGGPSSC